MMSLIQTAVVGLGWFMGWLSSLLLSSSTRTRFYRQLSSGQADVTGVVLSPRYLQFVSRIGSAFSLLVDVHRMWLTHALALSAYHFLCKKKSLRVCALDDN